MEQMIKRIGIDKLWNSSKAEAWEKALDRYWEFVKPTHIAIEREMESLDLDELRKLDSQGWYNFLHDRYFRWKYTAPNRYATTIRSLRTYKDSCQLEELYAIRSQILSLIYPDLEYGLRTAQAIRGLGVAGASGLLALMYPSVFGTVDQFVVKALRKVRGLPEADILIHMDEDSLATTDGVILIRIMQRKSAELNLLFHTEAWTPRKIDKILWTYGREQDSSRTVNQHINKSGKRPMAPSNGQQRRAEMTNHEMIAAAMKGRHGEILSTGDIRDLVCKAFSEFSPGSLLPNDHAEGNKSPCSCAGTERRLFDKIKKNSYRVR